MWNLTTEQLSLQSGQAVLQCVCMPYNACPEVKHVQRTTLIKLFSLLELVVLFFLVITFAVYGWFQQ